MANRVPLIINTNANQIQELAVGDHLDLTGSGISNAGVITATKFVGDGSLLTNIAGVSALSDVVDDTTPELGGNLDLNNKIINGSGSISISGGIQATSFTGNLIGNVTGNVLGNADTATTANTATTATNAAGLTGSPSIQVASIVVSGNILADTVSVASTLTYEDVTNIDSVGVVTARTGIKVLANGIDVVGVVTATSFSGDGSGLTNLPPGGISNIVEDTTPQLGGNLDLNSKDITGTGNIDIAGNITISNTQPKIFLTDTNNTSDFSIQNENGNLNLYDETNSASRLRIVASGDATFSGAITSNGITQYLLPTMGNGGQLGYDDGTKSLRLYANSSNGSNAKIQFHFNQSSTAAITFNQDSSATFGGSVSDTNGDLRTVPLNDQQTNANYDLIATDAGKCVHAHATTTQVTVKNSVFAAGDMVTILNGDANNLTITEDSGFALRNSGDGTTGNRVLGAFGMATIYFSGTSVGYISGAGLS